MTELQYDYSELVPLLYEDTIDNLLELDGDSDYVEVENSSKFNFDETDSFTVEAWVNTNRSSGVDRGNIVGKKETGGTSEGWQLRLKQSNQPQLFLADGTNEIKVQGSDSVVTGEWYHLAAVVDRSTNEAYLYVDGTLVDTQDISSLGNLSNDLNARIGGWYNDSNPDWWDGQFDEIRIWDRARSEDEINDNLSSSVSDSAEGLIGYWNFDTDRTTDITVSDKTSNGHDGTLEGDATIVSERGFIGYVDVQLDSKVDSSAAGLIIDFEIDGSATATTATPDTDFYGPKLDISTTDNDSPTNSLFIPQGEDSGRIHFTALSDAVPEEDEGIKITLIPGTDDFGNEYTVANNREVISLNGNGDYVEISDSDNSDSELDFNATESFTVEAWVKTDQDSDVDYNNIVGKKETGGTLEGWQLRLHKTNQPELFLADGTNRVDVQGSDSIETGKWYHLAGVVDRSTQTAKLYVDGILVDTQDISGLGSLSNSFNARFGTWHNDSNPDSWDGQLDEIRVWNNVRTEEEIRENLYASLEGSEEGLVGYWTFDTDDVGDDTVSDLSSSGNDGSFEDNQVVSLKRQTVNSGVSLDGSGTSARVNTFLEIENSESQNGAMALRNSNSTFATWVKPTNAGPIISKYDGSAKAGYFLEVDSDGNIIFHRNDDEQITSNTTIPFGEWSHVAITFDNSNNDTLKIYINGEEVASQNLSGNVTGNSVPVVIGGYYDESETDSSTDNSSFFRGSIDEVQIWESVLSEAEIIERMSPRLEADDTDLLGYWDFDDSDSSGTSISDLTGNGYTVKVRGFEDLARVETDDKGDQTTTYERTVIDDLSSYSSLSNPVNTDNFNIFSESSDPSVTFFVEDSGAFAAGIAFSDRFGDEITDDNDIVAQSTGEASFTVKLTSEPTDNVTITLSTNSTGTLSDNSITFDSSDWDTEKTVTMTGLTADFGSFDITASASSNDNNYNSLNTTLGVVDAPPTDTAKIKVTEGGTTQDTPEIAVNINGVQDALEGQPTPGQFTVSLTDEAPAGGYEVPYVISGTAEIDDYIITETENNKLEKNTSLGQSISLDGDNDDVEISESDAYNFSDSASFTVEAWIKNDQSIDVDENTIVSKRGGGGISQGWELRLNKSNQPELLLADGQVLADGTKRIGVEGSDSLTTGEWYHLAAVVDRSTNEAKLYVDGTLVDTQDISILGSISNDVNLKFGTRNSNNFWEGELDEIRIWDVARTQEEIQNNLAETFQGTESGLIGYWNFNNDSGTTAEDLSTNGSDGTLQGDAGFTQTNSGVITIDEGETSANIAIEAIDNDITEGDKTVTVTLEENSAEATIEILDDEDSGVELAQLSTLGIIDVPAIELEVTSAYDSGTGDIGLKITAGADTYQFATDTAIALSNGVEITIPANTTLNKGDGGTTVTVETGRDDISVGETSITDLAILDVKIVTYAEDETTGNIRANVEVRLTQAPTSDVTVILTDINGTDSVSFDFTTANWDEYQQTNAETFLELIPDNNGEVAINAEEDDGRNSINLSLSKEIIATPLGDENTSDGSLVITTEGEQIEFIVTEAFVLDDNSSDNGTVTLELFNRSADYTISPGEIINFDNGTQVEVTEEATLSVGESVEVQVTTSTVSTDIPIDETGSIVEEPGESTVAVRLTSEPDGGDAVLDLSISDDTEGEFTSNDGQTETLTFTAENWDEYQEVTLRGIDDAIDDGNVDYNLEINGDSNNADGNYQGFLDSLTITNEDNDITSEETISDVEDTDSDYVASLSVDSREVSENGIVTATISLNQPAPEAGINVEYQIVDGTADTSEDITVETSEDVIAETEDNLFKVYIHEGETSVTTLIDINDDNIAENREEFTIQLVDRTDEEDDTSHETLTLEVTDKYTAPDENNDSHTVGLQIEEESILAADLETTDEALIIKSGYDSSSGKITLEINDDSSSVSLAAGEIITFKNGVVIQIDTAVNLTAGQESELIDITLTEVPSYTIPLGAKLNFNEGSSVTVAATSIIDLDSSTLVSVEEEIDTELHPDEDHTVEVTTSDSIRAYVNIEVATDYDANNDSKLELKLDETLVSTFTLVAGTQLSFNDGETIVTVESDTDIGTSETSVPVTIDTDNSSQTTIASESQTTTATPFKAQITINDNDTSGVRITEDANGNTEVSGSYTTTEDGGEQKFYARLETEPTDEVIVYVGSSNSDEGLLGGSNLVELEFDNTNWETPQEFTVTGVDEDIDDGDIDYELITTVESDGDFFYREEAIDIEVTEGLDEDGKIKLQIDELNTERSELQEGTTLHFSNGTVATVETTVDLDNSTETEVNLSIDTNALGIGAIGTTTNGEELKVRETYYSTTDEIKLENTTENDITLEAGESISFTNGARVEVETDVTISANSTDAVTASLTSSADTIEVGETLTIIEDISEDIQLQNTDDDTADVLIVNFEEIAAAEGVANNFFTIQLGSEPVDTVTVNMIPDDDEIAIEGELAGETKTITFDSGNWDTPQTIEVTAVDDFEVEFDHTTDITFDLSESADSTYAGLDVSSKKVQVNIIDNDLPVASIQTVAGAIEANAPGYFTIDLDKTLPDKFDDTGLVVNYTVSGGTADTDGKDDTDDFQPIGSGTARIAPGADRTPLIAFPIDDFKSEGIPLDVTSAYSGGSVGLKIRNDDAVTESSSTLQAGTKLTFSNGAVATVDENTANQNGTWTLEKSSTTTVDITFTSNSPETSIPVDERTRIPFETLVVSLDTGDDYIVSSDADTATLQIEDNDVPGVRVVEVSEPTTVTEGETVEYYVSLLSEPSESVTVEVDTTETTRELTVTSDLSNGEVGLQINDTEVDSLTLGAGTILTFGNGAEATVDADTFITSDAAGNSVSITLNSGSSITTNDTAEYSYEELSVTPSLTFTSDNWYELQPVIVTGIDDNVVEIDPDGEEEDNLHQSILTYNVTSNDSDYDRLKVPAQIIDIKDRSFDSNETAESLTEGFLALEDTLNDVTLPIVGSIEDTGISFIEDFVSDLVSDVRSTDEVTAETLAESVTNAFNDNINSEDGLVTVEITDLTTDEIVFKVSAEDIFDENVSLGADLGLPALGIGIETEGDLELGFDYNLGFQFGLNTTDGFFIDTEETSLEANAALELNDEFSATGSLGFLQLDMENGIDADEGDEDGTGVDASFTINLDDSGLDDEGRLTFTELEDLRDNNNLSSVAEYGFGGDAALDFDVTTSIAGSTSLPSFGFNISSDLPLFNYTNADEEPAETTTLTIESNVTVNENTATDITVSVADNGNDDEEEDIRLPKGTELTFGTTKVVVDETVTLTENKADETTETGTIKVKLKDNDDSTNDTATINSATTGDLEASEFSIDFEDITLDFGSFVTGVIEPVVDIIGDIIAPIEPVVNVLNERIKFFNDIGLADTFDLDGDGDANIIEVAGTILETFDSGSDSSFEYIEFFNAIVGIVEMYESLQDLQDSLDEGNNFDIDFGSYTLQNFQAASTTTSASDVDPEDSGTSNLSSNPKNKAKNQGSAISNISDKIDTFFGALDDLGISIPLLEDPFTAINLFMGRDIDLVTYDMPELDLQFEIDKSFPILATPSVNGLIQGDFSVFSDLVFGLDTVGFSAWEETGFDLAQSYLVLDGLYLSDVDPDTGEDVDELSIDATFGIGAELNVVVASASVTGGLTGEVGLDVIDVGEYTGESDGRIRGSEVFERINDPTSMFELAGSIDAFFRALVKVGIDVGLFEITKTVYDKEFSTPLFEFTLGGGSDSDSSNSSGTNTASGNASSGYIEGGTVFLDTNFNFALDPWEPSATTDSEGNYEFEYKVGLFDANENGVIDDDEAQVVVVGGTDVTTGEPLEIPMVGEVGTDVFITPISTIEKASKRLGRNSKRLVRGLGLDPNEAGFDPYKQTGEGAEKGLLHVGRRIALHGLITNGSALLAASGYEGSMASELVSEAIVEKTDIEGKVVFRNPKVIEDILNRALQKGEVSEIDPELVSKVAGLVSSFNKTILETLDEQKPEIEGSEPGLGGPGGQGGQGGQGGPGGQGGQGGQGGPGGLGEEPGAGGAVQRSVNDVNPVISPLKGMLLNGLPKLAEEVSRGELTLEEMYESIDSKLNADGFELSVAEDVVEKDEGTLSVVTRFTVQTTEDEPEPEPGEEIKGTAGNDTLNGASGDDTIIGGLGNDLLRSDGGQDILEGRPENDNLLGGSGDDVLNGGIGRDRLNGGPGDDTLNGGASIDRFIFNTNQPFQTEELGVDEITDFSETQGGTGDIIVLDIDTFTAINSETGEGFSITDEFAVVTNNQQGRTSDAVIVYNSNNGNLFYNQNGSAPGFGLGGKFAVLVDAPELTADDFSLR